MNLWNTSEAISVSWILIFGSHMKTKFSQLILKMTLRCFKTLKLEMATTRLFNLHAHKSGRLRRVTEKQLMRELFHPLPWWETLRNSNTSLANLQGYIYSID